APHRDVVAAAARSGERTMRVVPPSGLQCTSGGGQMSKRLVVRRPGEGSGGRGKAAVRSPAARSRGGGRPWKGGGPPCEAAGGSERKRAAGASGATPAARIAGRTAGRGPPPPGCGGLEGPSGGPRLRGSANRLRSAAAFFGRPARAPGP